MKLFLEPILAKKGPSGDHMYFRNLKQQDPQPSQMFNNIITDLKAICSDPKNEAHVKNMLIHLCIAVGLDDSGNGLVARVENLISAEFVGGVAMSAKPEVVVGKVQQDSPNLFYFLGSEV